MRIALRILWALAGFRLAEKGFGVWATIRPYHDENPLYAGISVIESALGFLLLLLAWRRPDALRPRRPLVVLVLAVLSLQVLVEGRIARYRFPSLSTDSAAFSRYAGELLLQGRNPYAHSMHPALNAAPISGFHRTRLADGNLQDDFPYPALHIALDLPATATDLPYETTAAVLLLLFAIPLLAALSPARALAFALVLHLPWTMVPLLANGVTDLPWALFLACALLARGSGARALWAGLAAAQKHPGALGLLLLSAREARAGRGGRFLAVGLFVAFLPQAPFLFADPGAWIFSVTRIVIGPLVPIGPGVGILARSEGLEIEQLLSLVSAAIFLGGLLLERRGLLGRYTFLVPVAAFFLRPRYLFTYFLFWLIPFLADLLQEEGGEGKVEDETPGAAAA